MSAQFPPESARAAKDAIALITAYHAKDLETCDTIMRESPSVVDLMRCLLVLCHDQAKHRAELLGIPWATFIQTYGHYIAELTLEENP